MIQTLGAGAAMSFSPATGTPPAAPEPEGGRGSGAAEITTVERVDRTRAPVLTGDETFFEFLFRRSPVGFAELRERVANGRALESFTLPNTTVTVDVADTYEVTSAEFTHNVVALVEGSDPVLKDQYIFFGAHLDHVGYASGPQPRGRVNTPLQEDRIWNGADDDGSGSSALLGLAKAFATGPRPRRSVVFVWHAGEEQNLLGSRYMADTPVVPLESIQAQINIDMIGRNRDDSPDQADTLFVIGADRISTGLHNAIVQANASTDRPLHLDFEYNDPADPNSFYTRSDHYSYAVKDIPIAFFFTGTHADYHANTDTVDKILFPKLLRVADLIYRTGWNLANDPTSLVRDRRGPRAGKGFQGLIRD
jgi:Zn-dependent M28 family amino/carboxypeptidase